MTILIPPRLPETKPCRESNAPSREATAFISKQQERKPSPVGTALSFAEQEKLILSKTEAEVDADKGS
jgi:hypothetical protein